MMFLCLELRDSFSTLLHWINIQVWFKNVHVDLNLRLFYLSICENHVATLGSWKSQFWKCWFLLKFHKHICPPTCVYKWVLELLFCRTSVYKHTVFLLVYVLVCNQNVFRFVYALTRNELKKMDDEHAFYCYKS